MKYQVGRPIINSIRLSFRGIFSRNQLRKSFIGLLKKLLNLNVGLVCGVKMQLYIPLKSHVPLCQCSYPRIVSDVLLSALPTSAELQQLSFTDSISMLAVLLLLFLRSCYKHQTRDKEVLQFQAFELLGSFWVASLSPDQHISVRPEAPVLKHEYQA